MRDAFIDELLKHALADPNVVLITGDLGFGVLNKFWDTIPQQFINAGVAEQNMAALAAGLALTGKKVFTYSIGNFPTLRCLEQIRNDICYHDLDVTIVAVGGGFSYGQLGASHFATEDLAIMGALPNMSVIAPSNSCETRALLRDSMQHIGPKYFRLDKSELDYEFNPSVVKLGVPTLLTQGDAFTLVGIGGITQEIKNAAEELQQHNLFCDTFALNSIEITEIEKIVTSLRKTKRLITVEEHQLRGGLSDSIGRIAVDYGILLKSFVRLGLNNEFPEIVGDQLFLREHYELNTASIIKKVLENK